MTDRFDTAWKLALFVVCLAAIVVWGRIAARKAPAPRDTPTPPRPSPDDEPEPVCRTRGCTALATRGLPELLQRRPLGALVPSWVVADDPEAEVALCRAHHGVWTAALVQRAAAERAALEAHLAAQHREVVAHVAVELPKLLALAPPAVPLRPSPLRGATLPPMVATEAPVEPAAG